MKKSLLILGLALALFSCNKEETAAAGFKTAYVDTVKLVESSEELKDLEARAKVREDEMGRELQGKAKQWQLDYASFQSEARVKGMEWAQLRQQDLQKREQEIAALQEQMKQKFTEEFGVQRDTIVSQMRKKIKDFGKKNGYDYIYGTGEAATILYGKEGYDITEKMIKEINDSYEGSAKKEDDAKEDTAKAEEKK